MKRYAVSAFVVAAVTMVVVGQVWACTGQPQVFSVTPLSAVAGAEVTMRGEAAPAETAVELRWNGVAGPKLAEVTSSRTGSFALAFTVPDVAPGVYSLSVVPVGVNAAGLGRAAFEVRAVPGAAASSVEGVGSFASNPQAVGLHQPVGVNSFTGLAVGMGMLGFGTAALFAGFAVATVRRRAPAVSRSVDSR